MVSLADQVAAPSAGEKHPAQDAAFALANPPKSSLGVNERELRIDLFRGLALWLIFIDHASPDLLTWFTIRNYGFSDAAEIFIFVSGYTAAFVYGRTMLQSGFVIGAARIMRRVWQIYLAHVFLFMVFLAEIYYLTGSLENPYSEEMGVTNFFNHPAIAIVQTLLLRFRPLNMDVLPLYVVLMFFLPAILWLMKWRADVTLALSVVLYALTSHYDWYLSAYPTGFWAFNPFSWQLLFVFGAWCALGGGKRLSGILESRITVGITSAYLFAAFFVTLTWSFPQLSIVIPRRLEQWMYPIDKTDLDILRFIHFLALAAITVHLVPSGWPALKSVWLRPLILCGQHSLEIFCLGVFLSFAAYFLLTEISAGIVLHFIVGISGVLIMTAKAWVSSWYKRSDEKTRWGTRVPANADIVGGA
jgi:hypothetical protein